MKKVLLASVALVAMTGASLAGATYSLRGDTNTDTNGNGNMVSTYSSSGTGNGGVVGGNGDAYDAGGDQTNVPGSRADGVQSLHAGDGVGRNGNNGNHNGAGRR